MSEYGSVMSGNLDLNIGIISGNFTQNIHVGKSDALVLKLVEVCFLLFFVCLFLFAMYADLCIDKLNALRRDCNCK